MYELQFAFSLAGLTGARPLPEIYCFIYLTSGFVCLVLRWKVKYMIVVINFMFYRQA
jgi:hypothetical protein